MVSNYLQQVLKVVKEVYPGTRIRLEQNLVELTKNYELPEWVTQYLNLHNISLNKLRCDIYIEGQVVIEVHGEQHDRPIKFSNEILDPEEALKHRKTLDYIKQTVLRHAGVPSIIIWYNEIDTLDKADLRRRIYMAMQAVEDVPTQAKSLPLSKSKNKSDNYKRLMQQKAREWRRKQYQYQKARKKKYEKAKIDQQD